MCVVKIKPNLTYLVPSEGISAMGLILQYLITYCYCNCMCMWENFSPCKSEPFQSERAPCVVSSHLKNSPLILRSSRLQVDLKHILQGPDSDKIDIGIDLQDYYLSVEWDIMKVPAVRNEKFYSCCEEPYPDIIFNITLRRKTLFYTVSWNRNQATNLLIAMTTQVPVQ